MILLLLFAVWYGVLTDIFTRTQIYTWGCNDEYALGRVTSCESGDEYLPGLVQGLDNVKIIQVSAGDNHTAALADDGRVYCWGNFWVCAYFCEIIRRIALSV